tara:strand:+ start:3715 stop:4749 length:1035 start_codon:yes stop_codon:yes gene_type:complete
MRVIAKAGRTWGAALAMVLLLASCAETQFLISTAKRVARTGDDAPQSSYKIGNPYQIYGIWYYPAEDYEYDETGIASWYGAAFHGKSTANGGVYDMNALTAAHRTLPMPSYVRVTNLENGRSLVLEVNDRGPFAKGRIIDISRRGAQLLGFQSQGTARVRVQILADRSRAVASRMSNREELARVGSPITSNGLPKASVSAETLPVPTGGVEAAPQVTSQPIVVASNSSVVRGNPISSPTGTIPNTTAPSETTALSVDPTAAVTQEPVAATNIFVQAGAFGIFENANKVRARLSPLGNAFLDRVLVKERDLFRVRIGPLADVASADTVLSQVVATGYPDARIIVD